MISSYRSKLALLACATFLAGLAAACGTGLPAVLSSTPETVSIEFSTDDNLSDTTKLALEACAKHDLIPDFNVVEKTATPNSRVAKYNCVSPDVAAPAMAPAADEPAAADAGEEPSAGAEPSAAAPESAPTETTAGEPTTN